MAAAAQAGAISKRRKFIADGVFYAELNEFFQRELAEEGYSGVEVRVTPTVTDISMIPMLRARSLPAFDLTNLQSSALHIPRKSLESKVDASGNSHLSYKSASSFPRIQFLYMPQKFKTAVFRPLLSASLYATNCSTDWP